MDRVNLNFSQSKTVYQPNQIKIIKSNIKAEISYLIPH
jgi:hypothetical protein